MENPDSWGEAERVVSTAYLDWHEANDKGVIGLSLTRSITEALRKAGLLKEGL